MKSVISRCAVATVLAVLSLVFATSMYAAATVTLSCASNIGELGVAYNSALVASGGVAPYTFSITAGALPPGLSLDAATGAITGMPTKEAVFSYTAEVVDSQGNTAKIKCKIHV